jgi:hypothetical protein
MEQFITLIQGPAAATVLMGAILVTAYKFVINYVVPRIDTSLKESNERYKELIAEHKADREAWLHSIDKISERLDRMSEMTNDMAKTVEGLHKSVSEITQKLQDSRKI